MKIISVTIDARGYDADTGCHSACVGFECNTGAHFLLHGQARLDAHAPEGVIEALLVEDAHRQVMRMPEFRTGSAALDFACSQPAAA